MDDATKVRIKCMLSLLDEHQRRLYLAVEAKSLGRGGLKDVSELSGVSMSTIALGMKELDAGGTFKSGLVRKKGGGRRSAVKRFEGLCVELEQLMEPLPEGDSERVLWWTTRSLRKLGGLLCERGFVVSHDVVGNLLNGMGYSLRRHKRLLYLNGLCHDGLAQFRYINGKCLEFIAAGQPVISLVTDGQELVNSFKSGVVRSGLVVSDVEAGGGGFPLEALGRLGSFDVYAVNGGCGFVNLGDLPVGTVEFGVESVLRWWQTLGCRTFPDATWLYIVSDCNGCDDLRGRLWHKQLQQFADVTGLFVCVSHLPSGTSKWVAVAHELFCFTNNTLNNGGGVSVVASAKLISSAAALEELRVVCERDDAVFELGLNFEDLVGLNLTKDVFYGDWNYVISPKASCTDG